MVLSLASVIIPIVMVVYLTNEKFNGDGYIVTNGIS